MDTEQTQPKYLLPWCCPKCGVDCSASELGTKDYDNAIGYYLHCHACDVNFTHWENETRTPHCVEIDGQEYEYPREASPDTDVSGLVDDYGDIANAFGNQIVPREDQIAKMLLDNHDWTEEGAKVLTELAVRYGSFFLRNALALAIALNIEDGSEGF